MLAHWRALEEKTGKMYLGAPHRLDRPVSGALIFARHVRAAQRIAAQFEAHTVRKLYVALVEGASNLSGDVGEWVDRIRKVTDEPRAELAPEADPRAREARMQFSVLWRGSDRALLAVTPLTGRYHQIRIQAATRGFPVVGDTQYGATSSFDGQPPSRESAIALHARRLVFRHPTEDATVDVLAPFPPLWNTFVPPEILENLRD